MLVLYRLIEDEKDNYLAYTVGKVIIQRAVAVITTYKKGGGWWLPGNIVYTLCMSWRSGSKVPSKHPRNRMQ